MSGCVYLVTNKSNNKKYTGQHNKPDPTIRWDQHITSKRNIPFHKALRKYGRDAFTWEILCVCPLKKLTQMEAYYAEVFETYIWDNPGGYNAVWCSDSPRLGLITSTEVKDKIRHSLLDKKHNLERIERNRQSHIGIIPNQQTREKMSKTRLGKKHSPETKEKNRQSAIKAWAKKKAETQDLQNAQGSLVSYFSS